MNEKISIIIVSFNNPSVLRQTLNSIIFNMQDTNYEIVIVDNASHENNIEMIKQDFPGVKLVQSSTNLGFGKACNLGVNNAVGDFLLFINSDILLKGNPVPEMLQVFDTNKIAGSVGAQLHNPDGSRQPSAFRFPALYMRFLQMTGLKEIILKTKPSLRVINGRIREVDFVSGAFLLIPRKLFEELGGFDERYFMYLEDADLCFQIVKSGRKNYILNRNDVIHLNENHEKSSSSFVFYHLNKGHLLFYQKNFSKFKTMILIIMSRLIYTLKLYLHYLKKESASEIEKYKKVLSIYY